RGVPRPESELRTAEVSLRGKAELVFLGQRIDAVAVEFQIEHHWPRDAADRQIPFELTLGVARAHDARADEANRWMVRCVEHIRSFHELVQQRYVGVDARCVDRN